MNKFCQLRLSVKLRNTTHIKSKPVCPSSKYLNQKRLVILIIYYKVLWLCQGEGEGRMLAGGERSLLCFVVKSKQEMNEFFSGISRQCANVLPRPTAAPFCKTEKAKRLPCPFPIRPPLGTCHKILSGKKRKTFQCVPRPGSFSLSVRKMNSLPIPLSTPSPPCRPPCAQCVSVRH